MVYETKIIEVDDSLGFIIPDQLLKELNWKEGDSLYWKETSKGIEFFKV